MSNKLAPLNHAIHDSSRAKKLFLKPNKVDEDLQKIIIKFNNL